jgi:hypothetical protein
MEKLRDAIFKFTKDWEPHMAFWPPQPVAERNRHLTGNWLLLSSGASEVSSAVPMKQLFKGGICPVCDAGVEPRTTVPLAFEFEDLKGADMASVGNDVTSQRVVSADFVKTFLGGDEGNPALRLCQNTGKQVKIRYYELCPNAPVRPVPFQHLRTEIVKCKACGRVGIPSVYPVGGIPTFARKSDLDAIRSSWAFFVAFMDLYHVIIRADGVNPLKLKSGLNSVTFAWLGIANDADVFKNAPVRMLRKRRQ